MKGVIKPLISVWMALVYLASASVYAESESKPNILFILADDLGIECISSYGGHHDTPHIDQLAEQGMRFTHVFSNPYCSPSRASLLTGRYPFKHGLTDVLWNRGQEDLYVSPGQPSFARQLKVAGYATAIVGKWHMSLLHKHNTINAFGFDQYQVWQIFDEDGNKTRRFWKPHLNRNGQILSDEIEDQYGPDLDMEFLVDFINTNAEAEQPFLAYFSTCLPHFPWEPTPDSKDQSYRKPHNEHKGDPKYFPDMLAYLDKCVGGLLDALEANAITENTIVIFLADNGTDRGLRNSWGNGRIIRGGKGTMTDRGTRVPLIVKWPNQIKAGSTSDALIDLTDFFPTLCEVSGAPMPESETHGQSFASQFLGEASIPREWVHAQHKDHQHVRNESYILNNKDELRPVVEIWQRPAKANQNKNPEIEQLARKNLQKVFEELENSPSH